jgi:CRISPR-associated protein Cas1
MRLFVNAYGAFVRVKDGMFEVSAKLEGERRTRRFAANKISGLSLSRGTAISSEAVKLAIERGIDVAFVERDGMPLGRVWYSRFGGVAKVRKRQLVASLDAEGVGYVKDWISGKLAKRASFLRSLKKRRESKAEFIDAKIADIERYKATVESVAAACVADVADTIRSAEGAAGRAYFDALSALVPKEWRFAGRSFRPAKDPFNAFLNYAYGVLYSRVEKALTIAGVDPYLGFLHRDDYNHPSMVFDFIEPFRVYAEETVFKLFSRKKVRQEHVDRLANGVTLNKEGKALLIQSYMAFLDEETTTYKAKKHTRGNVIHYEAHAFASRLLKKPSAKEAAKTFDLLGSLRREERPDEEQGGEELPTSRT